MLGTMSPTTGKVFLSVTLMAMAIVVITLKPFSVDGKEQRATANQPTSLPAIAPTTKPVESIKLVAEFRENVRQYEYGKFEGIAEPTTLALKCKNILPTRTEFPDEFEREQLVMKIVRLGSSATLEDLETYMKNDGFRHGSLVELVRCAQHVRGLVPGANEQIIGLGSYVEVKNPYLNAYTGHPIVSPWDDEKIPVFVGKYRGQDILIVKPSLPRSK